MNYNEYIARFDSRDHILIRMTDSFPYFKEKRIISHGLERIETNYHIADGMLATYVNFELPVPGALSALISVGHIRFEDCFCDVPVLITNVSGSPIGIRLGDTIGKLNPNEVLGIHPADLKQETITLLERRFVTEYAREYITQDQLNGFLVKLDE